MKDKILVSLFIITISLFTVISLWMPDRDISVWERRKLAQLPKWDPVSMMNGEYTKQLERYVSEQFPFRDAFFKIKGYVSQSLFQMKEQNGLWLHDGAIYELHPVLDEQSVDHFIKVIQEVKNRYVLSDSSYFAIIPDKSDMLEDSIPKWDREAMKIRLREQLPDFEFIDLYDVLNRDSYYASDPHWRQEALGDVVNRLADAMGLAKHGMPSEKQCHNDFYGAYYGRMAHRLPADTLCYLSDEVIDSARVYDFEQQEYRHVYEPADLAHIDAYDVFLGGAKPLLIIENEQAQNNRELVVFRDSFASSLIPLFIPYYHKITMIDLRYVSSEWIGKIDKIHFSKDNQDVLFLYSAAMINQSYTMK